MVTLVTVLSLRQHGLSRDYAAPPHPLLQPSFVIAAHQGGSGEAPANSRLAFDRAHALSPQIWLHVDVRACADTLIAFTDEVLENSTNGQGLVAATPFAEIEKLDAAYKWGPNFPLRGQGVKVLKLDEVFDLYPNTPLILDIHSNLEDIHKRVVEAVERHQANQRVLIQSDHEVILSALKEMRPFWLYGTSQRDLTRSHLLSSLFLASMAPMLGDVLIAPAQVRGHDVLEPALIQEAHRRNKKIFVTGVNDLKELYALQKLGIDGILTDRPTAVWPTLKQNP